MEWSKGRLTVSCDPAKLDMAVVAEFLDSSSWSKGIPPSTVEKSLAGSLCFALLDGKRQIGLARVISDYATIAYLGDVFVLPEYRGRGLSKWLMECVVSHPDLQGLRRWILATSDAHGLYQQFGFTALKKPERYLWSGTIPTYMSSLRDKLLERVSSGVACRRILTAAQVAKTRSKKSPHGITKKVVQE